MSDQRSRPMNDKDISIVKRLLLEGYQQKRIASLFDVNQGRIAEINTGMKSKDISPFYTDIDIEVHYPLAKK